MDATTSLREGFDPLPEIKDMVRSAIAEGLVTSIDLDEYDHQISTLKGQELEDYLQKLWDDL